MRPASKSWFHSSYPHTRIGVGIVAYGVVKAGGIAGTLPLRIRSEMPLGLINSSTDICYWY